MNKTVIGIAVAIVVGLLLIMLPTYMEQINITGLNVQIDYVGSTSGYFGSPTQACPINITASFGQTFYITFTLTNYAIYCTHEIISISVNTPGFKLVSITPSTPISIAPEGSVRITLEFQAPYSSYTGPLTITIYTS